MFNSRQVNNINADVLSTPIPDDERLRKELLDEVISRAKLAFKYENYSDAELLYSKAIQITPDYKYISNKSLALLKQGKHQLAYIQAVKVILANPEWPKGYFRKAQACENLKYYHEAIENYQLALSKDNTNQNDIKQIKERLDKIIYN